MKKWQKLLLLWIAALAGAFLAPVVGFYIGEVIRGIMDPLGHVLVGMIFSVAILLTAIIFTVVIARNPDGRDRKE